MGEPVLRPKNSGSQRTGSIIPKMKTAKASDLMALG